MAGAAHRLGPKDKKNVGGVVRDRLVQVLSGVVDCYAAATGLADDTR